MAVFLSFITSVIETVRVIDLLFIHFDWKLYNMKVFGLKREHLLGSVNAYGSIRVQKGCLEKSEGQIGNAYAAYIGGR